MRNSLFLLNVFLAFSCLFLPNKVKAQSVPVGTPVEDYYRRIQLLGKVDTNLSFTLRPLFIEPSSLLNDSDNAAKHDRIASNLVTFAKGLGQFKILPLTWLQQFNSDHPYGWNDGAMIPAKGYQTMISGGVYLKFGPLSIQLRPEYVYANNPGFNGFAFGHSDQDLINYYSYKNSIDDPERYGTNTYNRLFLGQSSMNLTFGPISAGLSNENLWWGPGIRNTLILSNNAPGFKHFTLNTIRPIKTYIGFIEGQIIAGRLDGSGLPPLTTTSLSDGQNLYVAKSTDWRYFTGLNINYHPKWIPGLTLGLIRTFDAYYKDIKGFKGYFPFFTAYSKQSTTGTDSGIGDPFPRDQYTSLYARWLFTRAQAEIYFEYGLNDNSYNLKDFIGSPDHSRTYIFGLRKMVPLNVTKHQYILFSSEITQLSQSVDRLVRDAGGWYIHGTVSSGHTNLGQVLGAGTGSGGNLQSVDVNWISGMKKIGIGFERYEHEVDFAQYFLPPINNNSRKWVDFAFALQGEWNYKNLFFNAKLQEIKSLNYEWVLKDYDSSKYYIPHNDVYNFHGELGVTFRF
ncbi:MAG: capsule assembly Wzi family protein [Bacteroidota bacterium]